MDAVVYKRNVEGPATHAIVIGVGHYPHLPGGRGKVKFPHAGGMGQLKSPPASARALARWLVEEYDHPGKPLASLSLLISDAASSDFTFCEDGKEQTVRVAPATKEEVKPALRAWRELGNSDPRHLLLFFFCGHGIALEPDLALLLADFGAEATGPLDGAFNFRLFRQGMSECAAREQCYFVDACRVGSELLILNSGFAGGPIIQRTGAYNGTDKTCNAPVFYSTLSGGRAYAQPGKPSLFTQALLEAFAGAGSGDEDGEWRVRTNPLHEALGFLVGEASRRLRIPQLQLTSVDGLNSIDLNRVDSPRVPVVISCQPPEANGEATLSCRNGTFKKRRKPAKETWFLRLPVATYDFSARIGARDYRAVKDVRPTYRRVNLPIRQP